MAGESNKFTLEPMEPRIMLSAELGLLPAPDAGFVTTGTEQAVAQPCEVAAGNHPGGSGFAATDDLFEGLSEAASGEGAVSAAGGEGDGVKAASVTIAQPHQFKIEFDYSRDTSGFFNDPIRRKLLEEAASQWAQEIGDDFPSLPQGSPLRIFNPSSAASQIINLPSPRAIDDVLIFVGAADLGAGTGASALFAFAADASQTARLAQSDFQPWAGSITFNS